MRQFCSFVGCHHSRKLGYDDLTQGFWKCPECNGTTYTRDELSIEYFDEIIISLVRRIEELEEAVTNGDKTNE